MTWPTVTLVLGVLAFVAVLFSWIAYLFVLVVRKQVKETPVSTNATATRYGPQRIA